MPYIDKHQLALIAIPRNASVSLGRTFGFQPTYETAQQLAEQDPAKFSTYRKVVFFRETVLRFRSAVEWGKSRCEIPELSAMCQSEDFTGILDWLKSFPADSVPLQFRPQTYWTNRRIDTPVALHAIADFFNGNRLPGLGHHNVTNCGRRGIPDIQQRRSVLSHFSADEDLFAILPLWHPNSRLIVKLYGACLTCNAKRSLR